MFNIFHISVVVSFCCYRRCTTPRQPVNQEEIQQQEERRPLLARLRLRQRLSERAMQAPVELNDLSVVFHEAQSQEDVDESAFGGSAPIYQNRGARPRVPQGGSSRRQPPPTPPPTPSCGIEVTHFVNNLHILELNMSFLERQLQS